MIHSHLSELESVRLSLKVSGFSIVNGFQNENEAEDLLKSQWELAPQYDGNLINHVKSSKQYQDLPLSKSKGEIGPHTEGVAYRMPPRYLALYCVEQAEVGGNTHLYDGFKVFSALKKEQWDVGINHRFNFKTAGKFSDEQENHALKSIISEKEDNGTLFNFSSNFFKWGDVNPVDTKKEASFEDNIQAVIDNILSQCERVKSKVRIAPNSLLIWDNHRMLHGREGYSDPNRYLIRYWLNDKIAK
ncbi:TauD/TfdA family dioxygenase [Pseudoalteromonas aurantia]|uniref:TauD/TfdA-like domain-containing protein n=1 Tax=Pseudoalteromonas aurantia 208 TaxID=1314867 RepID=A0ABR9EG10_9GAMM|nr:TauD/TfdA family dioxygenase [Pseudoalteromonas aurantia]MBE0369940.1 hypothetical protein [Pseudoalteromonas aurantia 208]